VCVFARAFVCVCVCGVCVRKCVCVHVCACEVCLCVCVWVCVCLLVCASLCVYACTCTYTQWLWSAIWKVHTAHLWVGGLEGYVGAGMQDILSDLICEGTEQHTMWNLRACTCSYLERELNPQ